MDFDSKSRSVMESEYTETAGSGGRVDKPGSASLCWYFIWSCKQTNVIRTLGKLRQWCHQWRVEAHLLGELAVKVGDTRHRLHMHLLQLVHARVDRSQSEARRVRLLIDVFHSQRHAFHPENTRTRESREEHVFKSRENNVAHLSLVERTRCSVESAKL